MRLVEKVLPRVVDGFFGGRRRGVVFDIFDIFDDFFDFFDLVLDLLDLLDLLSTLLSSDNSLRIGDHVVRLCVLRF